MARSTNSSLLVGIGSRMKRGQQLRSTLGSNWSLTAAAGVLKITMVKITMVDTPLSGVIIGE